MDATASYRRLAVAATATRELRCFIAIETELAQYRVKPTFHAATQPTPRCADSGRSIEANQAVSSFLSATKITVAKFPAGASI
jgi:hypothetical protein